MAKQTEPWGPTTAALVAAVFAVIIDKVLLLDKLTEHFPFPVRLFFVALMALAAFLSRHYYLVLGGGNDTPNSDEREQYDTLRLQLFEGGTPADVYKLAENCARESG